MKKILLILIFTFSFLNANIEQFFPKLQERVVDEINLLSPTVKADLIKLLKEHEKQTSNQIVVVILKSLNGYQIEDYAYQLGRFWQIGQKDKNNGILLVISMEEKKMRIEVGYGLEGVLTDKISYEIINYTIKPNFKASQYELGVLKAINEIMQTIKGEYQPKTSNKDFGIQKNDYLAFGYFLLIFISIFINIISKRLKNQFIYKSTKATIYSSFFSFFAFFISQSFTNSYIVISIILFLVVFIFYYITTKNVDFAKLAQNNYSNKEANFTGFEGFNSRNSNSSSESFGGGFSGGGGSFGGGGASGGW